MPPARGQVRIPPSSQPVSARVCTRPFGRRNRFAKLRCRCGGGRGVGPAGGRWTRRFASSEITPRGDILEMDKHVALLTWLGIESLVSILNRLVCPTRSHYPDIMFTGRIFGESGQVSATFLSSFVVTVTAKCLIFNCDPIPVTWEQPVVTSARSAG